MPRPPSNPLADLLDNIADAFTHTINTVVEDFKQSLPNPTALLPGINHPPNLPKGRYKRRTAGQAEKGTRQPPQARRTPPPLPQAPPRPQKTAYDWLGVLPTADQETLKAVYRAKCRQYHPDGHVGATSTEMMVKINAAWEVLKDPEKREKYDKFIGVKK